MSRPLTPGLEGYAALSGRPIAAIVFDATGTLITLRSGVGRRYAQTAAAHGFDLDPGRVQRSFQAALAAAPPLCFPEVPDAERDGAARDWWRRVVAETVRASSDEPPPASDTRFEGFFQDLFAGFAAGDAWRAVEGGAAVLGELSRRGYRLGVLSNFDGRLPGILAALRLADYLAHVETSVSLGVAKPDPRAFLSALDGLGVAPGAAAYVGDSPVTDAAGAARAGLLPILLGAELPRGVAGIRIDRLADLLELFHAPAAAQAAG
ncbi:MAG TPA: HAD-IA family hydrolase [Gemmatimonadota bacterium]